MSGKLLERSESTYADAVVIESSPIEGLGPKPEAPTGLTGRQLPTRAKDPNFTPAYKGPLNKAPQTAHPTPPTPTPPSASAPPQPPKPVAHPPKPTHAPVTDVKPADILAEMDRLIGNESKLELPTPSSPRKASMAMTPKWWSERRHDPGLIISIEPTQELTGLYREALKLGTASAIWIAGYGDPSEAWLHGLLTRSFPDRKHTRVPRLAYYQAKNRHEYLWTGWGVTHEGRWYFLVWDMDVSDPDNPNPTAALLCDPLSIF